MKANLAADVMAHPPGGGMFRAVPGYEGYHINETGRYFKRPGPGENAPAPLYLLPEVVAGSQSYLKLTWAESVVWKPLLGVMLEVFPHIFLGPALVNTLQGPWSLRRELERSGRSGLLLRRAAGWPPRGPASGLV